MGAGRPFQGLSAASSFFKMTSQWKRRMREWDASLGLSEKITVQSIEEYMLKLDEELDRCTNMRTNDDLTVDAVESDNGAGLSSEASDSATTCSAYNSLAAGSNAMIKIQYLQSHEAATFRGGEVKNDATTLSGREVKNVANMNTQTELMMHHFLLADGTDMTIGDEVLYENEYFGEDGMEACAYAEEDASVHDSPEVDHQVACPAVQDDVSEICEPPDDEDAHVCDCQVVASPGDEADGADAVPIFGKKVMINDSEYCVHHGLSGDGVVMFTEIHESKFFIGVRFDGDEDHHVRSFSAERVAFTDIDVKHAEEKGDCIVPIIGKKVMIYDSEYCVLHGLSGDGVVQHTEIHEGKLCIGVLLHGDEDHHVRSFDADRVFFIDAEVKDEQSVTNVMTEPEVTVTTKVKEAASRKAEKVLPSQVGKSIRRQRVRK